MLEDPNFRRSPQCGYYEAEYILKRSASILEFPVKRITLNPEQEVDVQTVRFSQPFILCEENLHGVQGLKLPDQSTTLVDIAKIIGENVPVKVIEVGQQTEVQGLHNRPITVGEYAHYLQFCTKDHKILNMISLEVSNSSLNARVQAPAIVRQIDWIGTVWPLERRALGDFPRVQKYCLAGMAGSYTDFHIDFGGTSVWYHVLSGKKLFYLIAPTTRSLKAYQLWNQSPNQAETFFPDLLHAPDKCFKYELTPGETLVIPSGWIHAVYTPEKALVFGGNFVHCSSILRQLQVYSIECRTKVGMAYRFPYFRQINWYLLCITLPIISRKLEGGCAVLPSEKNNKEEEEDDNEEYASVCEALMAPHVVMQIPFLLKSCENWIHSIPLSTANKSYAEKQEINMFYSAAKTSIATLKEQREQTDVAHLPSPSSWSFLLDIISEWWQILQKLQEKECHISLLDDASASASSKPMLSNILRLKEAPYNKFDLLDEFILGDTGRELDQLMVDQLGEDYTLFYQGDSISMSESSAIITQEAVGSSELKLSLKLGRKNRPKSDESSGSFPSEIDPATSSSDGHNDSSAEPSLKLNLRGVKNRDQTSNSEASLLQTSSSPSPRYGTRSIRLSSTFLKNATDIDVDEVEGIIGEENIAVGDGKLFDDAHDGDGDLSDDYNDELEDGDEVEKPKRVKFSQDIVAIKAPKPLKLPKPPKPNVQKSKSNRDFLLKKLGMKR